MHLNQKRIVIPPLVRLRLTSVGMTAFYLYFYYSCNLCLPDVAPKCRSEVWQFVDSFFVEIRLWLRIF